MKNRRVLGLNDRIVRTNGATGCSGSTSERRIGDWMRSSRLQLRFRLQNPDRLVDRVP